MSRGNWVRLILPLGIVSVGLLSVYAAEVACEKEKPSEAGCQQKKPAGADCQDEKPVGADGFEVIFPPDRSVLVTGDFDVICKANGGVLEADGELIDWQAFKPPFRVAHVTLYSGRNSLKIGEKQVEIFVAADPDDPGGPDGWPLVRSHPISRKKRCTACHETKQEGELTGVGELKSYKACFECHEAVEFEAIHSHPLEPIEHCQMCHSPHGATSKALLKAPVKKLCAECHDS